MAMKKEKLEELLVLYREGKREHKDVRRAMVDAIGAGTVDVEEGCKLVDALDVASKEKSGLKDPDVPKVQFKDGRALLNQSIKQMKLTGRQSLQIALALPDLFQVVASKAGKPGDKITSELKKTTRKRNGKEVEDSYTEYTRGELVLGYQEPHAKSFDELTDRARRCIIEFGRELERTAI